MVGAASRPNLRNSLRSTGGTPFPQAQSVQPEHCSQIETVRRSGTSICVWICGSSASNRVGPGGSDSLLGRCVQRRATGHSRMITQEQFWRPHQSGHDPCDTAPRHAGRYREERWVCHWAGCEFHAPRSCGSPLHLLVSPARHGSGRDIAWGALVPTAPSYRRVNETWHVHLPLHCVFE